jgi:hypothetical protein
MARHCVQVLGFGDFYFELGVQIVEACLATRQLNGGLMDMRSLLRFVMVTRPCVLWLLSPAFLPLYTTAQAGNDAHASSSERLHHCMHVSSDRWWLLASRGPSWGVWLVPFMLRACAPALQRRRGSRADPVTEDDVLRAIDRLKVLGGGFDILTVRARVASIIVSTAKKIAPLILAVCCCPKKNLS